MSISENRRLGERWKQSIMGVYAPPRLVIAKGQGAYLWDHEGNRYTDLIAGIAVNLLGHAHPAIIEAVSRQVATLSHVSNMYTTEVTIKAAERLLGLFNRGDGGDRGDEGRVFFCNSGAEANEAAFKIARRTGRTGMVTAIGSFHGRTMGALSLTGQPAKQEPFAPLVPGVTHVAYGDIEALRAAVNSDTAAVLLEPIQGENGVLVPPDDYLVAARTITAEHGALLMVDEIQTGMGRTGTWFAHQRLEHPGVAPDVVTLAKGLGGGLPLGACVAFGPAAELLEVGQHGSTFGGNPIACAAALAFIDTVEAEGLLGRVTELGRQLRTGISGIAGLDGSLVAEVRGQGLLVGIELTKPVARDAEAHFRAAGYLVNGVSPTVIRLAPPAVIAEADLLDFVDVLPEMLSV